MLASANVLSRPNCLSQQNIFAAIKDKYFVATSIIFVVTKDMFVTTKVNLSHFVMTELCLS